jgi:hypothetical protein
MVAFAEGVSTLQLSLPQLSVLRRLELQYTAVKESDSCAALPVLPVSLTHLTLGVHGTSDGPASGSVLSGQPIPEIHGQVSRRSTLASVRLP